jgi:hypothetical protein
MIDGYFRTGMRPLSSVNIVTSSGHHIGNVRHIYINYQSLLDSQSKTVSLLAQSYIQTSCNV